MSFELYLYSLSSDSLLVDYNSLWQIYCCRDNHLKFIILSVCTSSTHAWERNECVCALDYYEITAANETAAAVCTACPPGSATDGITNSSVCGKYRKEIIPISNCFVWLNGLMTYLQWFWWSKVPLLQR